jgi:transcriptional regulator with XRE-family HTH domain
MDPLYSIKTLSDHLNELAAKSKELRLQSNLSRESLAEKSGVNSASLKRFEETGEISLKSFVKLMMAFDRKDELSALLNPRTFGTLEELRASESSEKRKRGRR